MRKALALAVVLFAASVLPIHAQSAAQFVKEMEIKLATVQPNGSMQGFDKNFHPWNYDANTKMYINYGTGKMCVGEGLARTCF